MENNALGVEVVGKDETRTLIGEIGRGGGVVIYSGMPGSFLLKANLLSKEISRSKST